MRRKLTAPQREILRLRAALAQIATMGKGMKPEMIDWHQIGKNATFVAGEALREKCKRCGK